MGSKLDLDIEELLESGQREAQARDKKQRLSDSDGVSGSKTGRYEREERGSARAIDDEDMHTKNPNDNASANGSEHRRNRRNTSSDAEDRASRRPRTDSSRDDTRRSDRGRDGDKYAHGGRYRSRSPARDYYRPSGGRRGGDDYHGRDRRSYRDDRDRDRGDRDRDDRRRRDDRDNDRFRSKDSPRNGKAKTPEPTDDERDRRTIFAQQLAARLRTKELQEFFTKVGTVVDAQIVKDRVSGRSKGVGYVEFAEEESVQKAIALTGQKLAGIPIIVQVTDAEKNRQARNNTGMPTQSNGIPFHRLYVGNIHFSVTEDDLTQVFEPFGELEFVQLQREEMGRSKGYGFVQFTDPTNAKTALQEMNGFEIAGRPIRVGLGNDKFTPETTANLLQRFTNQSKAAFQGSQFSGAGGRGSHAGGNTNFDRASGRDEKGAGGVSALDDSDVGGVNFNNYSRDSLMKKLARIEEPTPAANGNGRAHAEFKKPAVTRTAPSRCIVIKNVYNEAEEIELNGANWDKELEDELRRECSDSYGPVAFVGIFRDSTDGEVYVKFQDVKGGDNALKGLNGRFFAGRTLTAQPIVDAIFNMNFPKAANV